MMFRDRDVEVRGDGVVLVEQLMGFLDIYFGPL